MWEYQVNLDPNQTKSIWLINGTYDAALIFESSIVLVNDGVYPLTPTPTPTPTQTPTNTPTNTPTPTNTQTPTNTGTPTNTPTPTNTGTPTNTPTNTGTPTNTPTPTMTPTNAYDSFSITSGSTANIACAGGLSGTIYAENSSFDTNTQFYNNSNGIVSGNMSGFYSFGGQVVELDAFGAETGGFSSCSVVPTPTPTTTSTSTPTPTPTITPTASQTFFVTYSLGYDVSTAGGACTDSATPHSYYSAYVDRPQPNIGEFLYNDNTLTTPASDGFYSNGVAWWEITGGSGEITSTDPNGC
jgi:hypothetical protein